jgi:hypothetical protein
MKLKCPMCGGTELDEPRNLVPYTKGVPLVYVLDGDGAEPQASARFTRIKGRACKTCGHVSLTVNPEKLRMKLAALRR